ncbi:acyltransferase family protein [Methylovirgula sp. 4M-Z18]|uniref:acyltransferase family protein n=1 Tax=Methylovirgula sp. 4M-Z18 TaxID=2293567 RepID=UPI000E2F89F7|nr:acyltransferase [Methylovirgula sp. 4M-Z18]RFB80034.1 acyltransferase [Methylovirgula sp. 4M-Z18]
MNEMRVFARGTEVKGDLASSKVNKDIETLRAIAILFVLFHHFGFLVVGSRAYGAYWKHFGLWSGVDLFFCISGYIIAKSYYEQFAGTDNLAVTTAKFWIKRIFRLWPSAWLWLVIMVIEFTALGLAHFWNNFSDAIAAVLEIANFHWWMCLGGQGACGMIGNYWSLSLEEQFYMLFPFLFLLPRKFHPFVLLTVVMIQFPIPRLPWTNDFLWFVRTDAIALGVCIYLFSQSHFYKLVRPIFLSNRNVALIVSCGTVGLLAAVTEPQEFPGHAIVPFATGMIAIMSALMVFLASYDGDWLFNIPRLRPTLVWIGARSYALYLLQAPAYQLVHKISSLQTVVDTVPEKFLAVITSLATFSLMALLAELNYKYLETPLRRRGAQIAAAFSK